jgi:uncharacterized protein YneF (UPF0154 family)
MNTDLIIAITSIVVAISAAFGTYFSYKSLKADLKKQSDDTDTMIASIRSNQTQGNSYQNCNITYQGDVKDEKSISNDFKNEQSQ